MIAINITFKFTNAKIIPNSNYFLNKFYFKCLAIKYIAN